ncbi:MAG: HEPN domain-containing protein [Ignavibacteriales bacterium]|nr:HEPN domain-containing protein [Ignavibacteriales bacterium]
MKENHHKDLARHRLERAYYNLSVARANYQQGFYKDTVTKSYYAILTAMRALLALFHIDSKRHEGVITLFHKYFVKENLVSKEFNKLIIRMKRMREDADYGDYVEVTKEEATKEIQQAEKFLKKIEEVLIKLLASNSNKKQ